MSSHIWRLEFFGYPSASDTKQCFVGLSNLDYDIINSSERFLQRSTLRLYSSKLLLYFPKTGRISAYPEWTPWIALFQSGHFFPRGRADHIPQLNQKEM